MPDILPISKRINNEIFNNAHILYTYYEIDKYVENAVHYISDGIKKGSFILLIETKSIYKKIKDQLQSRGIHHDDWENITYLESEEFYLDGEVFDNIGAGIKLKKLLQPYIDQGHSIRTWGKVPLPNCDSLIERLINYECDCDRFIVEKNMISVCVYNGLTTPAYVQNELLKTHTHFMTDDTYLLSPLYNRENHHQSMSVDEIERLQRIEKQNQYLKSKNNHLTFENKLVKIKNEVIKQSEAKFRTIINELPIPIIIRKKSNVLFFNDLAQKQFLNQDILEEDTLHSFFENYDFNSGILLDNQAQEYQIIFRGGKKKYYLIYSIDMLFEEEEVILHSFVDMTQEKENEDILIRSEKLNIAGELAASIAHELRNPLTAIKGFFHMLKGTGEGKQLYFNVIEDELSRIEQIAGELLTLAKPQSENRRDHNIVKLIGEAKLLFSSQANMQNITILLESNKKEIYVNCEGTKIKQVFINLIKNAIDAMKNGGQILLKISEMENDVQIIVEDHGIGIPAELISKVGEPFYTTKEKGTGIGLMVCYQIIERHGGTIQVESQLDVGTTFTITLPAIIKNIAT